MRSYWGVLGRLIYNYWPTVSHGTIPATKQEFFFTKVAPVQSITGIIGFSINAAPVYFILHNHSFFRKECILFSNVYLSVNMTFEGYLFFGWEIGQPLSKCVTKGMEEDHPKCA